MGFRVSYLPYVRQLRVHGKSGYTWSKRLRNFIDLVIDSSYGPIQMMSRIGIFAAIMGIAYLLTVIYSWARGGTPFSGWAPIMVTLLILNGIVMTMLGIIGEYLWRIHDEIRQRPLFVVDESKPRS
jgi:dolichol-phosphate mannosyltransferase